MQELSYETHRVEMEIGGRTLSIETGHLAKQAGGSVLVTLGETVVLGAAVHSKPREGLDFFPLTVDYRERYCAAGKFPGGFRKREGAPSQREILVMRGIDRPIRPLFPKGFKDEVQIQCFVLAYDGQNEPDVLAGIAASAALSLSTAPFQGPVGNVRVGRVDGELCIMPTVTQDAYSDLDMLLCGHKDGINMIEVGAYEIPEEEMADAIDFGYAEIKRICDLISELQAKCGKEKIGGPVEVPAEITALVENMREPLIAAKTAEGSKLERYAAVDAVKASFKEANLPEPGDDATRSDIAAWQEKKKWVAQAMSELEESVTRQIIRSGTRTDGRQADELRGIECKTSLLPRVHGSGLFARGETQALITAVLGVGKDAQLVENIVGEYDEKFYLHYYFPPFSVGEAKPIRAPGRREIGHGKLAEKALLPVLPDVEDFPYTIRLVSDILESNGSSSMASACGGTLALMDAGVPIKAPVAGISIGLIQADEAGQEDVYLTDIQGEEDHFGDMDFKVCGTRDGITAIQVDLKIRGLSNEQIRKTFTLARKNRIEIIEKIEAEIAEPRATLSPYAPQINTIKINPEKIGKLIGPGGKMIRSIEADTGAKLDIEEDGTVHISGVGGDAIRKATEIVEQLCEEARIDACYSAKVVSTRDFGAFVEIFPGQDALCHISDIKEGFVKRVEDIVKAGDVLRVKVTSVDDTGRVKVSRKAALADEGDNYKDGASGGKAWDAPEERPARDENSDRGNRNRRNRKPRRDSNEGEKSESKSEAGTATATEDSSED